MSGNLILPRARVTWGDVNLSAYNGKGSFPQGAPLVYDVSVQLQSQSQAPTGSMSWDPTGPGFTEYEKFISDKNYMKSQIFVDFFYAGRKRIRFAFVWAGQSIEYGNDMKVEVKLKSELAGLIDATIRVTGQAHDENTGVTYIQALEKLRQQHQIPQKDIVLFNEKALEDLTKAKVISSYGSDQTYGAGVANLVQQNGNVAFASNIERPRIIIFPPYSWDQKGTVLEGAITDIPRDTSPDPTKRYGYILGPSIIKTMTRNSEWKPPQQTTQNTPNTPVKPTPPSQQNPSTTQNPPTTPQNNTAASARPSSSPVGSAGNRTSPGVQSKDNEDGPKKQMILTKEGGAELSFQTMLVPALVGIKPHDIVFIPSFKGDFIEDWIVDNVSYAQTNGDISVSVTAKRIFGLGTPMVKKNTDFFKSLATAIGLIGPNATLEAWEAYAWNLEPPSSAPANTPATTTPSAGPMPMQVIPFQE